MQVFLEIRNSCSLNVGLGLRFCSYIFPSIFRRYPLCESPPSFYKQGFICIFYLLLKRVSCRVNGLKDTCVGSRVTHERFLNCRRTENRPILHSSSSDSHPSFSPRNPHRSGDSSRTASGWHSANIFIIR